MKYHAGRGGDGYLAITCTPRWFGKSYTVYVTWIEGSGWTLMSGRAPNKGMLDAIDRLPGVLRYKKGKS